ncbi:MAG: O-antigen ligase family protein [Caldilineae bacterium]|nr:O-antigen ligase family protein [Chloroflexota bacterium]MCB9175796.1 O-antigen ligase family protein [Caldilineae bacterium]
MRPLQRTLPWRPADRVGLALLALAAALLAAGPMPLGLALVAAPIGIWLAARFPGRLLAGLLLLVMAQDALVGIGLGWLQVADEALVLAGAAGLMVRAVETGRLARRPFDAPSLGLAVGGLAAALLQAIPPLVAALGGLALFKGLLAGHLAARSPLDRARLDRFLACLAWLCAAFALVALVQRLGGQPVFDRMGLSDYYQRYAGGKAPSVFFNHNALGHVLVMGGALALARALTATGAARRRMAVCAATCLAGLMVSASRESWLGAAAGLLLAPLLLRSRRLWRIGLATSLSLGLGAALVYGGSETMRAEIARRSAGVIDGWQDFQLGFQGQRFRGEYRVYVLLKSAEVWRDQPWLGTGPGRFGGQVALRYPSPVYPRYDFLPLNGVYYPLDVFWARLLAEWGLVGAGFYLWAFGRVLLACRRAARAPDALARAVGLSGIVVWAAVLVFGVFAPALEDPLVAIPFWAWGGLAWQLAEVPDAG